MIFSADPRDLLILVKWSKNQPSTTSASACAQTSHYTYCRFWPFFAQMCFVKVIFFPVMGNITHVQGSISNARGTFEPKITLANPGVPKFGQKLKVCAKYFETKKRIAKSIFPLGAKSLKFKFVCSQILP